jgi:hypothetical protein
LLPSINLQNAWLAPRRLDARPPSGCPHRCPPSRVRKHVGPVRVSGDHLRLPTPDTETRYQKGEKGDVIRSSFKTFRSNNCNIRLKTNETFETCVRNTYKNIFKTLETIVHIRNIQIKHLHHMYENICNIHINTLATYVGKKQIKH